MCASCWVWNGNKVEKQHILKTIHNELKQSYILIMLIKTRANTKHFYEEKTKSYIKTNTKKESVDIIIFMWYSSLEDRLIKWVAACV